MTQAQKTAKIAELKQKISDAVASGSGDPTVADLKAELASVEGVVVE